MVGRFIKSFDGNRIYYDICRKRGSFLVFLHGWPHNHTVWKKELRYFQKKGYSTVAVDLRGHGKSDKPSRLKDYTFDRFAKDINLIINREKIQDFILIGHSLGGMIGLEMYSLFPKGIKALVLVDTIYENPLKHFSFIRHLHLTPLTEHVLKFILESDKIRKKHFPYVDFSKFKDHSDFFYWMKGAKETPMKSVLSCLEEMVEFNRKDVLKKIEVPTLIIEGEKDRRIPLDSAKVMAKKIKGAELKIIKGASHDVDIRRPNEVEHTILDFLDQIDSRKGF